MPRTVVVTGLGVVGGYGAGRNALVDVLGGAGPVLREVDRSAGFHHPRSARLAGLVGTDALAEWLPAGAARRMSPPSRFAVAAARTALADAGLDPASSHERTACVLGTAFGPTSYTERLLRQILVEDPLAASPSLFTECVANAPAAQVALAIGARGPNVTITQREAGPLAAVARAADLVRSGRAERALAGTSEEISPLLHAVLDRFRALARPGSDGHETARPFDRRRNGSVIGEGAVILLLETAAAARERGALPHAAIVADGRAFDPAAPAFGWGDDPGSLGRSLAESLSRAGLRPAGIEAIVSGASGSPGGDRLEAALLRAAWGEADLPPVCAPKAFTGEYGGGQLAAAVLAAAGRAAIAGPRDFAPDPAIGMVPEGLPAAPRRVLVPSLAIGGAASWLVLEPPLEAPLEPPLEPPLEAR